MSPTVHSLQRQRRYRRLVWLTLFLTFDLIVFGAFVRLSDAGLGCPDWPGCYGKLTPLHAQTQILAAQAIAPLGPVTPFKAWVEMIHRYLASGLGLLVISMAVLGWHWRRDVGRLAGPCGVGLFVWICLQGAFGALTVTWRLMPIIVTLHLLGGLGLLAGLCLLAAKLENIVKPAVPMPAVSTALWFWGLAALGILVLQIFLGGWVSTNDAVLACTDFPKCQGQWLPVIDPANGYTLWRPLGMTATGESLSLAALTAIHWVHRSFAWVVVLILGTWAWRMRQATNAKPLATAILTIVGLQVLSGFVTIVFKWPLLIAIGHSAGAAGLVGCTVYLLSRLHRAPVRVATS